MPYIPIIVAASFLVVSMIWLAFVRRMLALLEENSDNAMNQIGIQLSSRWDELSALVELMKGCNVREDQVLLEITKARKPISAENAAFDAAKQDDLLAAAMGFVKAAAEQNPALKADPRYQKKRSRINQLEGMARQSRLAYNDSVTSFNRQICIFPASLAARVLGFKKRDYLETSDMREGLPRLK